MATLKDHQYLQFDIKILKILRLWPSVDEVDALKTTQLQTYTLLLLSIPTSISVIIDSVLCFAGDDLDIRNGTQNLLATVCIAAAVYMVACFLQNRAKIKFLIEHIVHFKVYSQMDLVKIDNEAILYSKIFMSYSCIGTAIYASMPFLSIEQCEQQRTHRMDKYGMGCGVIVSSRYPFSYNTYPMFLLVVVQQIYIASTTSFVIVTLTMLLCGILHHVINQLKQLRKNILNLTTFRQDEISSELRKAVTYHIDIIEYTKQINSAFGTQLILHITLTSFVISVLGFEILMEKNFTDSLRFAMHLAGWLILLFFICHHGQLLIDESTGVAHDVYCISWYKFPLRAQKDLRLILMRAQKPLTLNANKLGVLSAPTFLRVLSSAYSYFTLLLNLKISE